MDNIKQFPKIKKTTDQKYHAILEENIELRKKLDALEKEITAHQKTNGNKSEIQKRLRQKSEGMKRRAKTMRGIKTIEDYEVLEDPDLYPELFGVLRNCRWPMHAVTTAFNLSVNKRRTVKGVSKEFASYTNATHQNLTLMRICINLYSTQKMLTTKNIARLAQEQNISKTSVFNFLKESVQLGAFEKNTKGIYKPSQKLLDDYFFNLISMLFSKETIHLVSVLSKVYGLVDLQLLAAAGIETKNLPSGAFKKARKTAYECVMDLVSGKQDTNNNEQ